MFYGAAEFSRDADFAVVADAANLARLRKALAHLQADPIAVPPFALNEHRPDGESFYGELRYGRVFVGHNGAQSYYSGRAFRGSLRV